MPEDSAPWASPKVAIAIAISIAVGIMFTFVIISVAIVLKTPNRKFKTRNK